MSMVKYSIAILLSLWLALLLFMPKQALYYKLEERLRTQEIVLNEERIEEEFLGLRLEDVKIYVKGIEFATVKEVSLFTLLFYSRMTLKKLHIDDSLKRMIPQEADELVLVHSVLSPLSVSLESTGPFGQMQGMIDIKNRSIYVEFNESSKIKMLQPRLKKGEKGWIYETSF